MARSRLLLLEYDAEAAAKDCGLVCSLAGPVATHVKEPVGHSFHVKILKQQGLLVEAESEDESPADEDCEKLSKSGSSAALDGDLQPPPGVSWKKSKSKRKPAVKKDTDYYALLGLQHERWTATEQQLKLSYRKVCLEFHPDKKLVGVDDPEEKQRIEDYFKQIQEAYDTLSDPAKRREYDSTDDFDDTLPTECDPADFFKVFGPAFRRNGRWSVTSEVPDVGDEASSWEDVCAFYDFWFTFKSWREFPHPDEEDVEGAESREHRRWIERMNAKLREKGKKEEQKRLRDFVDAAYRIDPRILAKKEADRAERERKKQEKAEQLRKQQEEEERKKAEEEARRLAEEEEAKRQAAEAKKLKEEQRRLLKKERQRLRQLVESVSSDTVRLLPPEDVEKLCQTLEFPALQQLADAASQEGLGPEGIKEVLQQALLELQQKQEEEAAAKEYQKKEAAAALKDMARRDHARKLAAMREWSDEELRLLDKAVAKFPQGTPKRWEQVAAMVRTRTLEEVLLMVKEHQGASSTRMRAQEDWKGAAKKRAEVGSAADLRCQAFTDVEVNLDGEAAAKEPGAGASSASSSSSRRTTPRTSSAGGAEPSSSGGGSRSSAVKKVVSADSGEWTEEQELALVQALKQCGKELPDRWDRIAALVPGKSKAQCFKRFKELRDVFRGKKEGGDE